MSATSGTTLFLSPHLDDVVWSCPGTVLRAADRGDAVVATCFTLSDGGEGERTRAAEDRQAVQELGATPLHLGLLDAPWRTPWWDADSCGFGDLMCGPLIDELVDEVAHRLIALCHELRPERVVAPLGVGLHIDHRTVHAATLQLSRAVGASVEFYEDRPYSFVDQSIDVRLGQLGIAGAPVDWPVHWSAFGAARYVRTFLASDVERRRVAAHVEASMPGEASGVATSTTIELTEHERVIARTAMRRYGSQVDAFLDDALLERCSTERTWRLA